MIHDSLQHYIAIIESFLVVFLYHSPHVFLQVSQSVTLRQDVLLSLRSITTCLLSSTL